MTQNPLKMVIEVLGCRKAWVEEWYISVTTFLNLYILLVLYFKSKDYKMR